MAQPARHTALSAALVLLSLTACSAQTPPQPTAAQAGETLKTHIDQIMRGANASDVKITDPGGKDIPCGEGKSIRTYAATGVNEIGSGDPDSLVLAMRGALDDDSQYLPVEIAVDQGRLRLFNPRLHTHLILESPSKGQMLALGETDCLPTR
ncbi:hypothetical protein J5X84_01350 [Streptosporangiaceae bacterium NEAU-GS5]|nr:hypothetical protein [Streptosporangiaceae bacterium NEAU-GS5]